MDSSLVARLLVGWVLAITSPSRAGVKSRVGPFDTTDASALDVLELEKPRRSTHRCDSHDDVQACSIGEECSKIDHGHRCALCAQRRNRRSGPAALSLALRLWVARVWQAWPARKNLGQGSAGSSKSSLRGPLSGTALLR